MGKNSRSQELQKFRSQEGVARRYAGSRVGEASRFAIEQTGTVRLRRSAPVGSAGTRSCILTCPQCAKNTGWKPMVPWGVSKGCDGAIGMGRKSFTEIARTRPKWQNAYNLLTSDPRRFAKQSNCQKMVCCSADKGSEAEQTAQSLDHH